MFKLMIAALLGAFLAVGGFVTKTVVDRSAALETTTRPPAAAEKK